MLQDVLSRFGNWLQKTWLVRDRALIMEYLRTQAHSEGIMTVQGRLRILDLLIMRSNCQTPDSKELMESFQGFCDDSNMMIHPRYDECLDQATLIFGDAMI